MLTYYMENDGAHIDDDYGAVLSNILITINLFCGGLLAFAALC